MPRSGPLTPIRRRARRRLAVAGTGPAAASVRHFRVAEAAPS